MQEEIKKHTQKIYSTVKSPEHSFKSKVIEITIEILIIVFAVSLSIWLHGWSEHRHQRQEAQKFLIELREDLNDDIELLRQSKEIAIRLDSNARYILALAKTQPVKDSVLGPYTDQISFTTNFNTGRYEGFKSSGKIGTIENDKLKNSILVYYQQTLPNLVTEARFLNDEQLKILNIGQNEIEEKSLHSFLTSRKLKSMYYYIEYNFREAIQQYESSIQQARSILAEIEKEAS